MCIELPISLEGVYIRSIIMSIIRQKVYKSLKQIVEHKPYTVVVVILLRA